MRRTWTIAALISVSLLLPGCGGDGNGNGETDVSDPTEVQSDGGDAAGALESCIDNDAAPCDDGDPCHIGEGYCLAGECYYEDEQKYSCGKDKAPDDCHGTGQCDGTGGCTWDLDPGYCFIADECVSEGTSNPDNPCSRCLPDENRGGWSPVSGVSCVPERSGCAAEGECQQGFCVPIQAGQECVSDIDCYKKDNGDLCDGLYKCSDSCLCVFDETTVVECETGDDTECVKNQCNPDTGLCNMTPASDGTSCSDDDDCTTGDYCLAGDCTPGQSIPPTWTALPPVNRAYIQAIAFLKQEGSTAQLFAVGSGGVVYTSKDLGETFTQGDLVAPGSDTGDWLFVTGTGPTHILAIFGDRLIVSNNSGLSYVEKLSGCEALARAALASSTFVAICGKTVYTSTDSGSNWGPGGAAPGSGNARITGLAVKDQNTMYAGTADEEGDGTGYLYQAIDGGFVWNQIDPPDRPPAAHISHRGLMVDPSGATRVFAGYTSTTGEPFPLGTIPLFRSDDGGMTFAPLNSNVQGVSHVPLNLDTIGRLIIGVDSGLARGGNFGGGPWGQIPGPNPPGSILLHAISSAAVEPGNDLDYFVPASGGLAEAESLGTKWTLHSSGMNGAVFGEISVCEPDGVIYAQERLSSALYRSEDQGTTWQMASLPAAAAGMEMTAISCSPANNGVVYAYTSNGGQATSKTGGTLFAYQDESNGPVLGSHNAITSFPGAATTIVVSRHGMGLFRSEDSALQMGLGFEPLGLPDAFVSSVAADPFQNGRLYAGTYGTPESPQARVHVCDEFGSICTSTLEMGVEAPPGGLAGVFVYPDKAMEGRVYAVTTGENGEVRYSNDYGNSWQTLVELPFMSTRGRGELLADPAESGAVLAALWLQGLFRYSDLEGGWTRLDGAPAGLSSLAYAPGGGGEILAGSGLEAKILASDDVGESWTVDKDFAATNFHVYRLVADGDYLFAVLHGKAQNEGKVYVKSNGLWKEAPVGTPVMDVAVQDAAGGGLLAVARFGGLYRSQDGGGSFAPFGNLDSAALDLMVMAGDPNTVLAAVDCGVLPAWYDPNETFLGSDCGVRRSVDGGETWFTVLNTGKRCTSLTRSTANPSVIIVTCPGAGAYYTQDEGSNWSNLTGWSHLGSATTAAIEGSSVFLGTSALGVVRAELNQESWVIGNWQGGFSDGIRELSPVTAARVEVEPGNPSRVMVSAVPGGLVRTDNFGSDWWYSGERLGPDVNSAAPGTALTPLLPRYVNSPEGEQLWVAVAGKGLFVSQDHGLHYRFASGSSLPVSTAHAVDMVVDDDYIGYVWLAAKEGFFRTADNGALWQKIEMGLPAGAVESILGPNNGSIYASVAGSGLFTVPYDGANWMKAHTVDFFGYILEAWGGRRLAMWHSAVADPAQETALLVATDPAGLFRTQDGGVTYTSYGEGLPAGPVLSLARSPHNGQVLAAGTPSGPFISLDGGATFEPRSDGSANPGACVSFAFDTEAPDVIYALCADIVPHGLPAFGPEGKYGSRQFYVSVDSGSTWQLAGFGLDSEKWPVQVLADPVVGGLLYVATARGGVMLSENGGDSFSAWSTGLPAPQTGAYGRLHASPLAVTADGSRAILGTDGFGFYQRVLDAKCE